MFILDIHNFKEGGLWWVFFQEFFVRLQDSHYFRSVIESIAETDLRRQEFSFVETTFRKVI